MGCAAATLMSVCPSIIGDGQRQQQHDECAGWLTESDCLWDRPSAGTVWVKRKQNMFCFLRVCVQLWPDSPPRKRTAACGCSTTQMGDERVVWRQGNSPSRWRASTGWLGRARAARCPTAWTRGGSASRQRSGWRADQMYLQRPASPTRSPPWPRPAHHASISQSSLQPWSAPSSAGRRRQRQGRAVAPSKKASEQAWVEEVVAEEYCWTSSCLWLASPWSASFWTIATPHNPKIPRRYR